MISKKIAQLNLSSDLNKDFQEKVENFKTIHKNFKDKAIKELFSYLAIKINGHLENGDICSLQDIVVEKSSVFTEILKQYDWPVLEKKISEQIKNRKTIFYYDLLKHRFQIVRKKHSHEYIRQVFDFYTKNYIDLLANDELKGFHLNEICVYQILSDWLNSYQKLLNTTTTIFCQSQINSRKGSINTLVIGETFQQDIEAQIIQLKQKREDDMTDFWEMFNFTLNESIFLTPVDELNVDDETDVLKNINILTMLSMSFKAKLIEDDVFSKEKNEKLETFERILNNSYLSKLMDCEKYLPYLKQVLPSLYIEINLNLLILKYIKGMNLQGYKDAFIKLIETYEYMNLVKSFSKRHYEISLIKNSFSTTCQSLIILMALSCFKSLNSIHIKEIFSFIDIDFTSYENVNEYFVLDSLTFPYFETLSNNFVVDLKRKAIEIVKIESIDSSITNVLNDVFDSLVKV